MTGAEPKAVADKFFNTWTTGDFDTARWLLHDNASASGPIGNFDNADAYMGALLGLGRIIKGAEQQRVFVDGDDVCIIYDLVTNTPIGAVPTAEWYHVRNGKIASVRTFVVRWGGW